MVPPVFLFRTYIPVHSTHQHQHHYGARYSEHRCQQTYYKLEINTKWIKGVRFMAHWASWSPQCLGTQVPTAAIFIVLACAWLYLHAHSCIYGFRAFIGKSQTGRVNTIAGGANGYFLCTNYTSKCQHSPIYFKLIDFSHLLGVIEPMLTPGSHIDTIHLDLCLLCRFTGFPVPRPFFWWSISAIFLLVIIFLLYLWHYSLPHAWNRTP